MSQEVEHPVPYDLLARARVAGMKARWQRFFPRTDPSAT
jgi:hypothetical protein